MSDAARVGVNFAILTLGQAFARLLSFAVTVHLGRALLAEGFGAIAFASGVLAYGGLLVDLGFDSQGPFEVARSRVPLPQLARNVVSLRLLSSVLAIAALAAFASFAPVPQAARPLLLLYALSLVPTAVDLQWAFLGAERMAPVALAEILQQALLAAGAFAFVRSPNDLVVMPLVFGASRAAAVAGLLLAFRRRFGTFRLGFDRELACSLLAASLPLSGSALAGALLHNFDLVLLAMVVGVKAAGLYGAAYRILWVPTLVAGAYYTALRPALARASQGGREALQSLLGRATALAVAFGSGVAVGGLVLAQPLLEWLFGPPYREATLALRVLLASCLFFSVSRLYRFTLVACGEGKTDLAVISSAAGLNVVLNAVLVPRAGIVGAAWATLAAEAFMLLRAGAAARAVAGRLPTGGALGRTLIAALALGLWLEWTRSLHVAPRAAGGAVVYLLALLALRVVEPRALLAIRAAAPLKPESAPPNVGRA